MRRLPRLLPQDPKRPDGTDSVVLAVYAPFGSDPLLSSFPDDVQQRIRKQPLVLALKDVARQGIHVSALIDLYDDNTYLVEIPAGQPRLMRIHTTWKEEMSSPRALAGFLCRVHGCHPRSAIVLAMEGHGAGYLPDLDATQFVPPPSGTDSRWDVTDDNVNGTLGGAPILAFGYPELPVPSPDVPAMRLPMSTWGLGEALRLAQAQKVPKPAVIHFDNCFNMSVEVLHTVRNRADYATSYCNYNFYSAGGAYPQVFGHLRRAGSATREQLATWFALENQKALASPPFFPTIGGCVRLADMNAIGQAIDELALALVEAMVNPAPMSRDDVIREIKQAITHSQQYDTLPGYELEIPDQLTDIASLADALGRQSFPRPEVANKASTLQRLLKGIKRYGDDLNPSVDTSVRWNFSSDRLAMNILLPDPALQGRWDWRSPYYGPPIKPGNPDFQRHHIDFLADRAGGAHSPWKLFIDEYHKTIPFVGLLRMRRLEFPRFEAKFDPGRHDPKGPGSSGPQGPQGPGQTGGPGPLTGNAKGLTRASVPRMPMGPRKTRP
jgi:hypothetical protein